MSLTSRSSGVLAPIFSLPGTRDLGALGSPTAQFVDFLRRAGQSWFQTLPVNPIDAHGSPYSSSSAFAGETLYLDLEDFYRAGLLDRGDLETAWLPAKSEERFGSSRPQRDARSEVIDYARARARRLPKQRKAFDRYRSNQGGAKFREQVDRFRADNEFWLRDYLLFQTASEVFHSKDWSTWPLELRRRDPNALAAFARENADRIEFLEFLQLAFDLQWREFKTLCHENGVRLFGDVPIYVAGASADAWARPELFMIDSDGRVLRESGAPADDFNPKGQPWNSPVYRWSKHRATDFDWWTRRMKKTLDRFDVVRLDHFIGFYNYYSFPGKVKDAGAWERERRDAFEFVGGRESDYEPGWTPGPQTTFFDAIFKTCPVEAFVAEDLGVMNDGVRALRDKYALPGMNVFQFSFDNFKGQTQNPLDKWRANSVGYTGTHDAAPILGWLDEVRKFGGRRFKSLDYDAIVDVLNQYARESDAPATMLPPCFVAKLQRVLATLRLDRPRRKVSKSYSFAPESIARLRTPVLRAVAASPCRLAIFPIQDVFGLLNDARINYPGVKDGNWTWRLGASAPIDEVAGLLREITEESGRAPQAPSNKETV